LTEGSQAPGQTFFRSEGRGSENASQQGSLPQTIAPNEVFVSATISDLPNATLRSGGGGDDELDHFWPWQDQQESVPPPREKRPAEREKPEDAQPPSLPQPEEMSAFKYPAFRIPHSTVETPAALDEVFIQMSEMIEEETMPVPMSWDDSGGAPEARLALTGLLAGLVIADWPALHRPRRDRKKHA
jgi:hypothetical protein